MTTLLEPPTIFAIGKPPNIFEGDSAGAPEESADNETPAQEVEEEVQEEI